MKFFLLISSFILISASAKKCGHKKSALADGCYKGKLEIKANCMNYTISIIDGNFESSMVDANWKDETTGKEYKNVFALGSRCNFPATINAGDEFYFKIDSTSAQNCAVCMMYYPVPAKHLSIKVLDGPCTE
jgi:hypothetical protein